MTSLKTKHLLTSSTPHYINLLKHSKTSKSPSNTKQFHARIIIGGLFYCLDSVKVCSRLVVSYSHCGHFSYARQLFDELPERKALLYNNLMTMYANRGFHLDVIKVFIEMLQSRYCLPDNYTYPIVVKACAELSLLGLGKAVHGQIMMSVFGLHTYVQNALLAMYMNCGEMETAKKVFDCMKDRSVVSWNTMINGYFKNGFAHLALMIFNQMINCGVEIDCATVVSVLPACGHLRELEMGKRVHALIEEKGLSEKISARNALIDMYARCGRMGEASLVFDRMMDERDVISWTTMIYGFILNGDVGSAMSLCRIMQIEGIRPNSITIVSLLSACASLTHGRCLHGWAIRHNLDSQIIIETSLIDMYARHSQVDLSFRVFIRSSRKQTVQWNAILSGCIHNSLAAEAIRLFKQMLLEGIEINAVTLKSLLPAYASLADLLSAKNIHCYLVRSGFFTGIEVATCLIDIYSKCGSLEYAHQVFNVIPSHFRDIFVWSVIIAGYGVHGYGETAVSLFRQMVQSGVEPNEVTFTSTLHACSHSGLVDEGLCLFEFMFENHKISPNDGHYTCIIDLLGRASRLDEAYNLIRIMPFTPSNAVWGALLGACVIHGNVEVGEVAAKWLFQLEPENSSNYVLLAKLYAVVGRWEDAEKVRRMMNDIGLRKAPAHSFVDAIHI